MIAIQKVLTDFQMICSSVSWFGRFMKVSVVMDDFMGRTITDRLVPYPWAHTHLPKLCYIYPEHCQQ
jgi:hypothetical protein